MSKRDRNDQAWIQMDQEPMLDNKSMVSSSQYVSMDLRKQPLQACALWCGLLCVMPLVVMIGVSFAVGYFNGKHYFAIEGRGMLLDQLDELVVIESFTGTQGHDGIIASPSIIVMPSGDLIASWDGADASTNTWVAKLGKDSKTGWETIAKLPNTYWASLFHHNGMLHLIGTTKIHGLMMVAASPDGGKTWPAEYRVEFGHGYQWHRAPTPVVVHDGKVWVGMEQKEKGNQGHWPRWYKACVLSAPVGEPLYKAASWSVSIPTPFPNSIETWMFYGGLEGWLEGGPIVGHGEGLEGTLFLMLRVHTAEGGTAALARVESTDSVDPASGNVTVALLDWVNFPGGSKKFSVRYDNQTGMYWTLVNTLGDVDEGTYVDSSFMPFHINTVRRWMSVSVSKDLREWTVIKTIIGTKSDEGVQYADWDFDGEDIVAVIRCAMTPVEEGTPAPYSLLSGNAIGFKRIKNFRSLLIGGDGEPEE